MVDVSQEVIINSGEHSRPTHSQISAKEEAVSLLFLSHEFSAKRWPRGKFRNKSKSHNKFRWRLWMRTPHPQLQSKTQTLNQLRSRDLGYFCYSFWYLTCSGLCWHVEANTCVLWPRTVIVFCFWNDSFWREFNENPLKGLMCCLAVNGQYLFVKWLFRREFVRGPRMIGLLGREMASIYLWNDSFGRSSLEDQEWLCYWAMKWPVFICGMILSAGVRQRTTNDCIIGPWNGQYLFVEWLFRRELVRGPQMIVLLGREMASIYLWNDSFGGSSLEDHEWLYYWAVRGPVFICGMTLSAGVRERTTNICDWAVKYFFISANSTFKSACLLDTNLVL